METNELPKLRRVVRLDSIPLTKAYYTDEGYLMDKPILTSTGIFEYKNSDGSVRRELRLPEEVFAKESLASYKGKPIIITHDAGLVTKDNVANEIVGTILTDGFRDGENVRAEIVIHDTDAVKDRGYKELSLGYNLDLEETPGVWHGEHYDAIQRNITINHLALVREARAGEQARLNIDSRDSDTLKGGKSMKTTPKKTVRGDGILSKEELEQAIKEYKARRAKDAEKDEKPVASEPEPAREEKPEKPAEKAAPAEEPEKVEPTEKEKPAFDEDVEVVEKEPETIEEKIQKVKDNRNSRDEEGDPKDKLSAMGMIAHQDEDIDTLFDIIDTLLAEREFKMKKDSDDDPIPDRDKKEANCDSDEEVEEEEKEEEFEIDEDDEDVEEEEVEEEEEEEWEEDEDDDASAFEAGEEDWDEDEDDDWEDVEEEEEETFATDSHDSAIPDSTGEVHHVKKLNSDSVDAVIKERIALGMMGRKLNMDGLEKLGIMSAKKRIIKAVRPGIRLDGKSDAYINAAYDCAVDEIKKRSHKGVKYQKKQMFNKDSKAAFEESGPSSSAARQAMIERQTNRNK